jgi:hypothetical protein
MIYLSQHKGKWDRELKMMEEKGKKNTHTHTLDYAYKVSDMKY